MYNEVPPKHKYLKLRTLETLKGRHMLGARNITVTRQSPCLPAAYTTHEGRKINRCLQTSQMISEHSYRWGHSFIRKGV